MPEILQSFDWLLYVIFNYILLEIVYRMGSQPIGKITRLLLPLSVLPVFFVIARDYDWKIDALLIILQIIVSLVLSVVWQVENSIDQEKRDRHAKELLEKVIETGDQGKPSVFCLYLRPFYTTDQLEIQSSGPSPLSATAHIDLETVLERALESVAPLITFGRLGEISGAGRIASTESEWQNAFEVLAKAAAFFFVIPSDHEGTLWEIQWLRDNKRLSKCIFIMPETVYQGPDWSADWENTVNKAKNLGLYLPTYDKKGLMFVLDERGHIHATHSLYLSHTFFRTQKIRRAVSMLINASAIVISRKT